MFLSRDNRVAQKKQAKCYRRLAKGCRYADTGSIIEEGWETPVKNLGLQKATQFVILLQRGKGDSVKEIAEFWNDATVEEIHSCVRAWKAKQAPTV